VPQTGHKSTVSQVGWRARGPFGGFGLLVTASGSGMLDDATAGRQVGGTGDCRVRRARGRSHHAEKNVLQPWRKEQWVLPPEQNADFVCAMEDVLEVYQRPYDPQRPVVCFDEQSRQLTKETRRAIPAAPGRPARVDYEYERNGTANLFMIFEPLAGKRRVKVTDRRTALDFAEVMRELVDSYPTAEKIVLVMDNLNTHKMASLYEVFCPWRIAMADRTAGGSLYAETRQLAGHGQDGVEHMDQAVPPPEDSRQSHPVQ